MIMTTARLSTCQLIAQSAVFALLFTAASGLRKRKYGD